MIKLFRIYPLFLRFWIATIGSELASRMHSLILIWIIYKWSHSALIVGIAMVAASLPAVLIAPFAGSMVDRHNKITIMMIADFFRLLIILVFAWLYYIDVLDTKLLIIGTMAISLASAFFNPASLAIIPSLVKENEITQANAIEQISGSASAIIGPLFGSAIIATLGVTITFIVTGAMFLVSVLFLFNIKDVNYTAKKITTPFLEDIKAGIRLVKQYTIVNKMILKMAIVNFFYSSLIIIIPIIAKGNVKIIAYLMSAIGVGMLTGSLTLSNKNLPFKPGTILSSSFVATGSSFIFVGFTSLLIPQLIEMFIIGFSLNVFNITIISLYQKKLPAKSLGIIMSFIIAVSLSSQPISYGIMGAIMGTIGTFYALIISGSFILLSSIGVYRLKELNS